MAVRYVSPTGANSGSASTEATAWLTLQYAVDTATPGDDIQVLPGTYATHLVITVSGASASNYTRLRAAPGYAVRPLIDGTNVVAPTYPYAVLLWGVAYWEVSGFEVINAGETWGPGVNHTPQGISCEDKVGVGCHHILISNNYLHDIRKTSHADSYALPIVVGSLAVTEALGCHHVEVRGNEVGNCDTWQVSGGIFHGSITVAGNVSDYILDNNYLHDEESLGGCGAEITGNQGGGALPNQPRQGVVSRNRIVGNLAQGLYLTSGLTTVIERNYIERCGYGVEVSSELGAGVVDLARYIWVRNNVMVDTTYIALVMGAWSVAYGNTVDCWMSNNTVKGSGGTIESVYLLAGHAGEDGVTGDSRFVNNVVSCSGKALLSTLPTPAALLLDYNVWHTTTVTPFSWLGVASEFPYNVSQDTHSYVTSEPLFGDDYRPSYPSRAHSIGTSATPSWYVAGLFGDYEPPNQLDFLGHTRVVEIIDIGAIELPSRTPMDITTSAGTLFSGTYYELPAGYTYLTAAIVLGAGNVLKGKGSDVTYVVAPDGTGEAVTMSGAGSRLEGVTILRQSTAASDAGYAVVVSGADCTLIDVDTYHTAAPTTGFSITAAGDRTVMFRCDGTVLDLGDAPTKMGVVSKTFSIVNAAAKGTNNVHALIDSALTTDVTTGFTDPATIRNLRVVKSASWDGGTVTVTGTDQYDRAVSEVFPVLTAGTEVGTKIFKTVTSCSHSIALDGGSGYSIGTGDLLGVVGKLVSLVDYSLQLAGVAEAATLDLTVDGFTPTTVPDGAVDYHLVTNIRA